MRRSVLADTGPLYAAVDPDDANHIPAQRELRRLSRSQRDVIISYPALLEAYTLVLYRLGHGSTLTWLDSVLGGASMLNPTPDDYREAANRILVFPDQEITLFDAPVAVLEARLDVHVWTYDYHFDVPVWR